RRHTRLQGDWSSDVCSSDLTSPEKFLRLYSGSFFLPNHKNFVGMTDLAQRALERGECYIQDPSTAIACELLGPQPGEKILDACEIGRASCRETKTIEVLVGE